MLVPLIAIVGRVFTVITALPLMPPANAVHLLSLMAVTLYVLVDVGDTINE